MASFLVLLNLTLICPLGESDIQLSNESALYAGYKKGCAPTSSYCLLCCCVSQVSSALCFEQYGSGAHPVRPPGGALPLCRAEESSQQPGRQGEHTAWDAVFTLICRKIKKSHVCLFFLTCERSSLPSSPDCQEATKRVSATSWSG